MVATKTSLPDSYLQEQLTTQCCKTCLTFQPVSNFYRNKLGKGGRASSCKDCKKIYDEKWRVAHKEQLKIKKHGYYIANKENLNEITRRNYEANREKINKKSREKRQQNPEVIRLKDKKLREKCKDKIRLRTFLKRQRNRTKAAQAQEQFQNIPKKCSGCKVVKSRSEFYKDSGSYDGCATYCKPCQKIKSHSFYMKNQDRIIHATAQYAKNNKDALRITFRIAAHRRRARKLALPDNFNKDNEEFCLRYWNHQCAVCGRGNGFWFFLALDHFIPLVSPHCPGTTPGNIIPLCHGRKGKPKELAKCCNQNKQAKDPMSWLATKLGPHKAKMKIKQIEAYFRAAEAFTTRYAAEQAH